MRKERSNDHTDALDMLVLHNECMAMVNLRLAVVTFVVSLFACNVPSELKRVVRILC